MSEARYILNQHIIFLSDGALCLSDLPDIPMIGEAVEVIRGHMEDGTALNLAEFDPDWLMEVMEG